jgi:hypothetical protein
MKSAFETLVLHISGLENGLHEQKGKLAAEAAQHATTKNELLKGELLFELIGCFSIG